jgi:outer membrane protein assembly factor BamB
VKQPHYIRVVVATCCLVIAAPAGADWRAFRGTSGNPVAEDAQPPLTWNDSPGKEENLAWKIDLPGRGPSSPIVVGDKVIVTASDGYQETRIHALAFSVETGRTLWHRTFWATGRTYCHPTTANAAPTPTSDGKLVFAFYSSNDLACIDLDGNFRWFRGLAFDYPKAGNDVGMASSPVVVDDTVVVQVENQGNSFATGIDKHTGQTRWRIKRPPLANWSSPLALDDADGNRVVLLQSTKGLTAIDPGSGKEKWHYEATCAGVPSSVTDQNGSHLFTPSGGILALKLNSVTESPSEAWRSSQLRPSTASPILHAGRVYTSSSAGIIACGDARSGKIVWRLRLKGPIWSTPVIAGNHMYVLNGDGLAQVVRLGEESGELVSTYDFGTTIQATAAVSDGAYFVRSDRHLWKIASP